MEKPDLKDILEFAADYVSQMLGTGTHTSRVVRCATRLVDSYGMHVEISTTLRHFTICIIDADDNAQTRVFPVPPIKIGFSRNADLSALSWQVADQRLSLPEARERFSRIMQQQTFDPRLVTLLVGVANACFCHLFGGDIVAMVIVFFATVVGFMLKGLLMRLQINHFFVFAASAFVASLTASVAVLVQCTDQIAIGTSPLFLIPGVPLINGVIDIMDGHILVGISRIMSATLSILCIAIGLSLTLLIIRSRLL